MSDGLEADVVERDGVLTITVSENRPHQRLDGEGETDAPVVSEQVAIRADEEIVKAVGHALLGWFAEQQPVGPPEGKSVTQQMDEAYDR